MLALGGTWLLLSRPKKSSKPVAGTDLNGIIVTSGPDVASEDVRYMRERLDRDDAAHPGVHFRYAITEYELGISVTAVIKGDYHRFDLSNFSDFDEVYKSALSSVLQGELL